MHKFLKFIYGNKNRHVSEISSVHHQEFFTVHRAMGCHMDFADMYHCCVCSEKFLMMDRGTVRNM